MKQRFPGQPIVYYGSIGLDVQWYLGPGELAGTPEQLAQLLDGSRSGDLLVVCAKAGARCLDDVSWLRAQPLIEQWNPALSRWVPAQHRFTLLRVERAGG